MMVTIEDSLFVPLLANLQKKSTNSDDKIDAYLACSRRLKEGDVARFVKEMQPKVSDLLTVTLRDVDSDVPDVCQASMQMLGFCLFNEDVAKNMPEQLGREIIHRLCDIILKTTDKSTCTRALWCLAKQSLPVDLLEKELHRILCAIEHGQNNKNFQSMTVEHEGLNATIRLLEQLPRQMEPHVIRWGKLVYPLLVHGAHKMREKALRAMELGMPAMVTHKDELGKTLLADLKAVLITEMKKVMCSKNEIHVMTTWSIYVTLLGKLLHHGSLINQLLPIVEQGFKNPSPDIKCHAYKTWETLIDNFALTSDIIKDHKRVKLLMQVFRINNAKVEPVAIEKMRVWWHFVVKLGDAASVYFEQVCQPLLQFSINGAVAPTGTTPGKPVLAMRTPKSGAPFASPTTPQMSGSAPTPYLFRKVQYQGAQALALMLGTGPEDDNLPRPTFTLEPLHSDIVTGVSSFMKHAVPFITSTKDCLITMGSHMGEGLLLHIWYSLVSHMKNLLEGASRKDAGDPFECFLAGFQEIVNSQSLQPLMVLKLIQATLALPAKALASSAYYSGSSSEIMQHCPVLALLELLFHHRLLETCGSHERFFSLLEKLVECGFSNQGAALGFCHSTLALLDKVATNVETPESLWRMWSIMTAPLLDHILLTNEVNQGNNLEHDFSCLYEVLAFPAQHLFSQNLPQMTNKTLMKTWGELYSTFARLAALVPNVEANVCCEELCAKMLRVISEDKLADSLSVDDLIQLCLFMVGAVDFSTFSNQSHFALNSTTPLSPTKFTKRRQRPLGNLHSMVSLCEKLALALQTIKKMSVSSHQMMVLNLVQVFSTLFTHIPLSSMITPLLEKLAAPIGVFYEGAAGKPQTSKVYSQHVIIKLEKLWTDIVTVVQGRYAGPFDSDFLQLLAPLLSSTFTHPRRQIRNQTHMLWNATFARETSLDYPESLKPVLTKVKERNPIVLPGWEPMEVTMVDDTPVSQMSMAEPQVPVPNIIGFPSPHKAAIGSFLNKSASPDIKNSPLRSSKSLTASPGPVKKKLSLGLSDMNTQDFVVIKSPPPSKKRVLTEHQKEVLKEKTTLPAMYNNLDASMDVSLSQFSGNDTQMGENPTPDIQITPFPFRNVGQKKSVGDSGENLSGQDSQAVAEVAEEIAKLRKKKRGRPPKAAAPGAESTEAAAKSSDADILVPDPPKPAKRRSVRFSADDSKTADSEEKDETEQKKTDVAEPVRTADSPTKEAEKEPQKRGRKPKKSLPNVDENPADSTVVIVSDDGESDNSESLTRPKGRRSRSHRKEPQLVRDDSEKGSQSPSRSKQDSPQKSPKKATSSYFSLDNWLKGSSAGDKDTAKPARKSLLSVEDTQELEPEPKGPAPVVFAEDTQQYSPSKFAAQKQTDAVCVEETPLKTDDTATPKADADKAAKNLFTDSSKPTDSKSPVSVPDSQVADSSVFISPSRKIDAPSPAKSDCSVSEPMVKLFRLSQDEINRYSPRKKRITSQDSESESQSEVDDPVVPRQHRRKSAMKQAQVPADPIPDSQQSLGFQSILDKDDTTEKKSNAMESDPLMTSPKSTDSELFDVEKNPDIEPMDVEDSIDDSNATIIARPRARQKDVTAELKSSEDTTDSSEALSTSPLKQKGRGRKKLTSSLDSSLGDEDSLAESQIRPIKPLAEALLMPTMADNDIDMDFSNDILDSGEKSAGKVIESVQHDSDSLDMNANCSSQDSQGKPLTKRRPGRPSKKRTPMEYEMSADFGSQPEKGPQGESLEDAAVLPSDSTSTPQKKTTEVEIVEMTSAAENENTPRSGTNADGNRRRSSRKAKKSDKAVVGNSAKTLEGAFNDTEEDKSSGDVIEKQLGDKELDELLASDDDVPLTSLAQRDPANDSFGEDLPLSSLVESSSASLTSEGKKKKKSPPKKKKKKKSLAAAEVIILDDPSQQASSEDLFDSNNTSTPVKPSERKRRQSLGLSAAEREARRLAMDVTDVLKSPLTERKRGTKLSLMKPNRRSSRRSLLTAKARQYLEEEGAASFIDIDAEGEEEKPAEQKTAVIVTEEDDNDVTIDTGEMTVINNVLSAEDVQKDAETALQGNEVKPEDSVAEPKDSVAEPEDSSVEPKDSVAEPKDSVVEPKDSVVEAKDSVVEAKDSVVEAKDSVAEPKDSVVEAKDSVVEAKDSVAEPKDSVVESIDSVVESKDSVVEPEDSAKPDLTEQEEPTKMDDSNGIEISDTLDKEGEETEETKAPQRRFSPRKRDAPSTPTSSGKRSSARKTIMMSRASLILQRAHMVINKTSPPSLKKRSHGFKAPLPHAARPGILKSPETVPGTELGDKGSPPSASMFRPIHLPKIYSPSASPSAGILRKRKLSGTKADTPSPPNKQRRVSFNEAIHMVEIPQQKRAKRASSPKPVNRCLEMNKKGLIPSPLVTTSKVISAQSKFITTPSKTSSECKTSPSDKGSGLTQSVKDSQMSLTQASVHETQESQLDCKDPIYPAMVDCETPVDHILPQLTSSMWVRGLGQVVRAKKIRTIGDMSALTEQDIHNLPIRSPKVKTLKEALAGLEKQRSAQKIADDKEKDEATEASGSPVKSDLPSADDVLDILYTGKPGDLDESIEESMEASTDIPEEVKPLDDGVEDEDKGYSKVATPDAITETGSGADLLQELDRLRAMLTVESLSSLRSHQLVELHTVMSDGMSNVVIALKNKCKGSPASSPDHPGGSVQ